jgi:uncharacterized protein
MVGGHSYTSVVAYIRTGRESPLTGSVAVLRVAEETFYGEIVLEGLGGERTRRVDARPSDAIALAVRLEAPIYGAPAVLEEGGYDSKRALLDAKGEDLRME